MASKEELVLDPTVDEIIRVLRYLNGMWKEEADIRYLLERYHELKEYLR